MNKLKKIMNILLVLWMLFTFSGCDIFTATEAHSTDVFRASYSKHYLDYSADDIRQIVDNGGQIYKNLRIYDENYNITTYQVPVTESEIERFLGIQSRNSRSEPILKIV